MNYKTKASINIQEAPNLIPLRLENWADKYNFKLINNDNFIWTYKRGGHFRASCSFDVRYVPTEVRVEYLEITKQVTCLFHVKSIFYHAMPSDSSRVDEQLELLIAYLKGAFDEKLSFNVKI